MDVTPAGRLVRAVLATTLAAAGLVMVTTGGPAGATVACQRTFTNGSPQTINPFGPMPIPPFTPQQGLGSSPINDVAVGTVADVDITVHVTHANADQLSLSVMHNAVGVALKNAGGTAGANVAGTTFDDEATQDISSGAPPYTGRFRPAQPLSAYDGAPADGNWTLTVSNNAPVSGTIDSWSVTVTYSGTCDDDVDGVEDHADACPGLAGHTTSGCPLASSGVTAKYRHGSFKGVLSSAAPACRSARSLTVWKVHAGPDRKVGSRTTASDGSYKLRRAKHPGRYYATAARTVVPGAAECPAVTSPTFRLR